MIRVSALKAWLTGLSDGDDVGIDEGGLQLCEVTDRINPLVLEVGGLPDEVCEECKAAIFYEPDDDGASQHEEHCSMHDEKRAK